MVARPSRLLLRVWLSQAEDVLRGSEQPPPGEGGARSRPNAALTTVRAEEPNPPRAESGVAMPTSAEPIRVTTSTVMRLSWS